MFTISQPYRCGLSMLDFFKRHPFLAAYVVLLFISYAVWFSSGDSALPKDRKSQRIIFEGEPVQITYLEQGNTHSNRPTLLLIHGSPGRCNQFAKLLAELPDSVHAIALDLPGFGFSDPISKDYSFENFAQATNIFLDSLGIKTIHSLGYSMGGGIILHMADQRPERVKSHIFLSSIGLQEYELTGLYSLNHSIHALLEGLGWAMRWGFPHFGWQETKHFLASGKQFFDSDQRPLRLLLQESKLPFFMVYGKRDDLVPFSAGRAHHALVQQSRFLELNRNHFYIFDDLPPKLSSGILQFMDEVNGHRFIPDPDSGNKELPPYRIVGLSLFIICFLIALATFISEDLTCFAAGLLVAQGTMGFLPAALACTLGIVLGDVGLYIIGRVFGSRIVQKRPFSWVLTPHKIDVVRHWFDRNGFKVIFISRFTPGTRFVTYVTSGITKVPLQTFGFYFLFAALAWTPLLVALSMWLGTAIIPYFESFASNILYFLLIGIGFVWLLQKWIVPLFTYRGRYLIKSRLLRFRKWEFWPAWLFNIPVILNYMRLAIRFKSPTLFAACNPGIPDSGFVGESKAHILSSLQHPAVAKWTKLDHAKSPEHKIEGLNRFLAQNELIFPIAMKPDVGQRGSGVKIVRNLPEAELYFSEAKEDVMVQEYVAGIEYGIFYIRFPWEKNGFIFSVTQKEMLFVRGDGQRNIEQLILEDERAVCMASFLLDLHEGHLNFIPKQGVDFRLVELGTHSRGSVFRDGKDIITKELSAFFDEVSKSFEGFYFGRYDVRGASKEAFKRAEHLKIIELNGVTSEATHIYEPQASLIQGYKTLFLQWEYAFKIGQNLVQTGMVAPPKLSHLLSQVFAFWTK